MKAEQTNTLAHSRTPPPPELADLRILIVEDMFLVAMEIERMMTELKCRIVGGGPVPRLQKALAIVRAHGPGGEIDGVLLDVNLNGEESYPIAEELIALGIPFILMTGYGSPSIPEQHRRRPRLTKPFGYQDLIDMMVMVFAPLAHGAVTTA
jgi:CheY-like chemotaxis protein